MFPPYICRGAVLKGSITIQYILWEFRQITQLKFNYSYLIVPTRKEQWAELIGTNLLLHDILVLGARLRVRGGGMKSGGLCILPLIIKGKRNAL
jgi:hypothetical protein